MKLIYLLVVVIIASAVYATPIPDDNEVDPVPEPDPLNPAIDYYINEEPGREGFGIYLTFEISKDLKENNSGSENDDDNSKFIVSMFVGLQKISPQEVNTLVRKAQLFLKEKDDEGLMKRMLKAINKDKAWDLGKEAPEAGIV